MENFVLYSLYFILAYAPPVVILISYLMARWLWKRKNFTSVRARSVTRWRRVMWAAVGAAVYEVALTVAIYLFESTGVI